MEDTIRHQERIAQQVVATMIHSQISNGDVWIEDDHSEKGFIQFVVQESSESTTHNFKLTNPKIYEVGDENSNLTLSEFAHRESRLEGGSIKDITFHFKRAHFGQYIGFGSVHFQSKEGHLYVMTCKEKDVNSEITIM